MPGPAWGARESFLVEVITGFPCSHHPGQGPSPSLPSKPPPLPLWSSHVSLMNFISCHSLPLIEGPTRCEPFPMGPCLILCPHLRTGLRQDSPSQTQPKCPPPPGKRLPWEAGSDGGRDAPAPASSAISAASLCSLESLSHPWSRLTLLTVLKGRWSRNPSLPILQMNKQESREAKCPGAGVSL